MLNKALKCKQLSYAAWVVRLIGLLLSSIAALSLSVILVTKAAATPPNEYKVTLGPSANKPRTIIFPTAYSLGELMIAKDTSIRDEEQMLRGAARGKIIVPAHQVSIFVPANRYYLNPKIGETLPADAFDRINLAAMSLADSEDGLCDRALSQIGHFKGVVELNLDRSDATDAGVVYANQLPLLQSISADRASIEGKCFKQFGSMQNLRNLRLTGNCLKAEYLRYLAVLPHLEFLNVNHAGIDALGVKNISACDHLIALDLSDNFYVNDKNLDSLVRIKTLHFLNLLGTSVTVHGACQLRGSAVKALHLPILRPSAADRAALAKALPGVIIIFSNLSKRTLNNDQKALFAPLH